MMLDQKQRLMTFKDTKLKTVKVKVQDLIVHVKNLFSQLKGITRCHYLKQQLMNHCILIYSQT